MSARGRHSRRSGPGFYRDVLFLIAGILIVGAIVFGGLSLWAGRGSGGTDTTSTSAPSSASTTTTTGSTSTVDGSTSTVPDTTASTTDTTSTTVREARPPGEVTVLVLNSTGQSGIAADLTSRLEGLGYQTLPPDNYTPELPDTTIFYADGFALEAQALADSVPGAIPSTDQEPVQSSGADLVVVLGSSYQG